MKRSKCVICHQDSRRSHLIQDEHYKDVWCHLECLNTKQGRQWREDRANADPLYRRYLDLISYGRQVKCHACGNDCRLFLKAVHTAHVWEMNCTLCGSTNHDALDAYTESNVDLINEIGRLMIIFLHTSERSDEEAVSAEIRCFADHYDDFGQCDCGGIFSIAAEPRCGICGEVIIDSYFHIAEC